MDARKIIEKHGIDFTNWRTFRLKGGSHSPPNGTCEMCAEEAAFLAAKARGLIVADDWSDKPERYGVSAPTIAVACRRLNDSGRWRDDEHRTRVMAPLVLAQLGIDRSRETEQKRCWVLADAALRVFAVAALRHRKRGELAAKLAGCARIVDVGTARAANAAAVAADAAAAADAYAAADLHLRQMAALLWRLCGPVDVWWPHYVEHGVESMLPRE